MKTRSSYILGGEEMERVYNPKEIEKNGKSIGKRIKLSKQMCGILVNQNSMY